MVNGVKHISENISIGGDKSMVTVTTGPGLTMYGNEVIKGGIFKWTIKMISFKGKDGWFPYVGIVENDEKLLKQYLNNVNFDHFGYLLCAGDGAEGAVYDPSGGLHIKARFVWEDKGDMLDVKLD